MLKLYSWNVNGIRATQKKGFLEWLHATQPDILGLQETKAQPDQLEADLLHPTGYQTWWASAQKKGYSGVALYSKTEPLSVQVGLGIAEYDDEGRTLIAEYPDFVFITTYVPHGKHDLSRVPFALAYKEALIAHCAGLRAQGKRIIICGDINISHQEIDIARPKENMKNTGFLPEERAWMDKLFGEYDYIDSFRRKYPDKTGAYSWWTARGGAREKNVGWRLDYFVISSDLWERVDDAAIHPDVLGSDHCPVSLVLK